MSIPVFILEGSARYADEIPGGVEVVNWLDICHGQRGKRFLLIDHQPRRDVSRWVSVENKRKWHVQHYQKGRFGWSPYKHFASSKFSSAAKHALVLAKGLA